MAKKVCKSCSGPLDDFKSKDLKNPDYCPYCVNEQGEVKDYKDILDIMIDYIKQDHPEIKEDEQLKTAKKWVNESDLWKKRRQMVDKIMKTKGEIALSTASKKGQIHVCMMNYVQPETGILLMTGAKTGRKIVNIKENPLVGLVKFEIKTKPSLLLYGQAQILSPAEAKKAYKTMLKLAPEYKEHLDLNNAFIKIELTKVIYEFYAEKESEYFELEPYI